MVARVDTRRVAFVATVEAQASKAEAIASAFEEAENPEALAVTLFKRGEHRAKVSAYYAEQPARPYCGGAIPMWSNPQEGFAN